jgi:hypothetical protein
MPYKLRKAPRRELYWVIAQDGRHMSRDPLPKTKAMAQMRALYAAMARRGEPRTVSFD